MRRTAERTPNGVDRSIKKKKRKRKVFMVLNDRTGKDGRMAKQMDNLKPCPFCGGEVEIESYVSNEPVTFADAGFNIKCKKCRIGFSKSTRCLPGSDKEADEKVKQELAERWNTRKGGDGNG